MVAVTMIYLQPLKHVLLTIQMLLGRFLALTSTKYEVNERMWRASEVVIDYDLSIASQLDRYNNEKQIQ